MGFVKDRWFNKLKEPTARHGKNPDKRYQVWATVDGQPKYIGAYRTQGIARRHLVEQEAKAHRGLWVDPTDQTTVSEYARRVAATRPHSARTASRVDSMIRNHLDGTALGGQRVGAVRRSDAQAWVTDRAQRLAPTTIQQMVKFVSGVFTAAVHDRLIATSPFVKLSLPRADQERVVPLTVEQVAALADTVKPRYRAMVLAQAGLGLRLGELLALRVSDANFLRRGVRVEHQIDKKTRQRIPPKTPKSRRTVPLPDMVSVALAEHIRVFPPTEDGLIFHTSTGMPYWHEYYTQKVFKVAAHRAALPAGTTTHALRHHFASVLLAAGESVVAVAERLGHDDATLVLSTYGHLMPDSEDRTRKAIDGAWNALSGVSGEAATAQGRPK